MTKTLLVRVPTLIPYAAAREVIKLAKKKQPDTGNAERA